MSVAFWPATIAFCAIGFANWSLLSRLPNIWSKDEYYSHGWLVPAIVGVIIFKNWDRISRHKVKPGWGGLIALIGVLAVSRAAYVSDVQQMLAICFIASILAGIWFVAGIRWMFALLLPVCYFIFMLPVWGAFIDNYTNPLQLLSTKVAFGLLDIIGLHPIQDQSTVILLDNFVLDVGVPCSGFKLMLAVTAFSLFFMGIARLGLWGNMLLAACIVPLCLFINGLRIAMIGFVGNQWGSDAGHTFHDYSGYIGLVICFLILFKIARLLGWKD